MGIFSRAHSKKLGEIVEEKLPVMYITETALKVPNMIIDNRCALRL